MIWEDTPPFLSCAKHEASLCTQSEAAVAGLMLGSLILKPPVLMAFTSNHPCGGENASIPPVMAPFPSPHPPLRFCKPSSFSVMVMVSCMPLMSQSTK